MSESLSSAPSAAVTAAAPSETFSQGGSSYSPGSFESSSIVSPQEALSPTIDFSGGSFIPSDTGSVFSGTIFQFGKPSETSMSIPEIGPLPQPFETIHFHEGPEKSILSPVPLSPILPKIGSFTEPLDKPYELPGAATAAKRAEESLPDEMYEQIPAGELPSPEEAVSAALALLGFSEESESDSSDMAIVFEGIDELLDEAYEQHQRANPHQTAVEQVTPSTVHPADTTEIGVDVINEHIMSVPEPTSQTEHSPIATISQEVSVSETVITEEESALSPEIEQAVRYVAANASHAEETLQALNEIKYPEPETVLGKILTAQLENVEVEIQSDPQTSDEQVEFNRQLSFVLRDKNGIHKDVIIIEWVRDEKALEERNTALASASERAYRHNENVNGPVVLRYYHPSERQKSEPLQGRPRTDNSLTETVGEIRSMKHPEEKGRLLGIISRTTEAKPPVRIAVKGKPVTDKDVSRVFRWPIFDLKAFIKQIKG
ncbi:MAG: hypothetical protein NUV98_04705 [Candidatus Roizmanbacteria bacterium]|nr:hypothetical protein [Candidatus Roizmanbacteria bacterium]